MDSNSSKRGPSADEKVVVECIGHRQLQSKHVTTIVLKNLVVVEPLHQMGVFRKSTVEGHCCSDGVMCKLSADI